MRNVSLSPTRTDQSDMPLEHRQGHVPAVYNSSRGDAAEQIRVRSTPLLGACFERTGAGENRRSPHTRHGAHGGRVALTLLVAAVLIGGLAGLSILVVSWSRPESLPIPAPARFPETAVSARDLYDAYEANGVAARRQYHGRWLVVDGVVDEITEVLNAPAIVLTSAGIARFGVYAVFDPSPSFSKLQKGKFVRMRCRVAEEVSKVVLVEFALR